MSSPPNHSFEELEAEPVSDPDDGVKETNPDSNERTDDWTDIARPTAKAPPQDGDSLGNQAERDAPPPTDFSRENEHSHSLRSKLVLALAFMLALVVGIDELVRQKVIAPEFAALERVGAIKDTNRVVSAIDTEIEFLAELAAIGAAQLWQSNHSGTGFEDCFASPGSQHRPAWTATLDGDGHWQRIEKDANAEIADSKSLPLSQLRKQLRFECFIEADNVRGTVLDDQGQPHMFAAVPAKLHQRSTSADLPTGQLDGIPGGEPARIFVVGRRLDQTMVTELQRRTRVDFALDLNTQNTVPAHESQVLDGGDETYELTMQTVDQSQLVTQTPLIGVHGRPIADLVVQIPRDVTSRSKQATAFARSLSLCGITVSLVLLLILLQRIVVGRLKSIREQTERIARTGFGADDLVASDLVVSGDDEIGQLARSFDRMRSRLGDAQRRLSDASHAAGMSFVADTVIHNVGNVLTNVNSLIETAGERVHNLRIEPLEKLADRLREQDTNRDLYLATPDYLQRLSQTLEDDKDELAELLKTLNENVQHIHQVIRDQSRHTRKRLEWSSTSISSMVGEAVRCCRARLQQDHVRVHFDNSSDAEIRTDRSLLLQVLINIISNAGNAMRGVRGRQPELRIDLIRTVSTIHLRFRDNGCGMDAQTLSRIFDAHFTTRQTGSGLGLHFCAITIKRVGGSIHAESDGPEKGATFILELPLDIRQKVSAKSQYKQPTMKV